MIPKNLDDLCRPIVPPPGVGDTRPVLAVTQRAAINSLTSLAALFRQMADEIEREPWCDVVVDALDASVPVAIETAADRLAIFRHTRDCGGEC